MELVGRGPVAGFRPYATAFLISEAGSAVSLVAMPLLVYRLTSSSLWTAAVAAASAVPYLLLGLFAGAIADRYGRAHLMVGANALSGLALLSIPVAYWLGHLTAPQVVLAALISQAAFVFYDAANFGFLMSLVGRDGILAANGFLYSSMSVLEALGPGAVGLALGHVALPYFILVDAASFLVSALVLSGIPAAAITEPEEPNEPNGLIAGAIEGVRYFRENSVVGRMTLVSALMTAANGGVMSVLVIWITHSFHLATDDGRIGLYYVAMAVSGIAAGRVAGWATRRWSSDWAMRLLIPASAVIGYLMLLAPNWWLAAILLGLSSGLALASVIVAVSARQRAIPDRLQSRVNTLGRMLAFGLGFSVGAVIAGSLGQTVPIVAALALVLLLRIAAAILSYLPAKSTARDNDEVLAAS